MHIWCSLVCNSNSPVMLLSFRTLKSKRGIRDGWSEGGFYANYHLHTCWKLGVNLFFFFFTNVRWVALLKLLCSVCFLELFLVRGGSQDQTVTRHTDGLTPSMSFRVLYWRLFEALLWLLCGQILFWCTWSICVLSMRLVFTSFRCSLQLAFLSEHYLFLFCLLSLTRGHLHDCEIFSLNRTEFNMNGA